MLIYTVSAMGFFACLGALFGEKSDVTTFEDLKGTANQRNSLVGAISIIMLSMIGPLPLAGFLVNILYFIMHYCRVR